MHPSASGQCVISAGSKVAEDGIITPHTHEHLLHPAARECIVPVGNDDIVTEPGIEHANCVLEVASRSVGVLAQVSGRKPQVLSEEIGSHVNLSRHILKVPVADQAVDILPPQAGILYGIGACLHMKADGCSPRNAPLRCIPHPDNSVVVF
jgi:hypothetical protein